MQLEVVAAEGDLQRRFGADLEARGRLDLQPKSVSYTHLRAHETVLDLVCRLLLEKKKTKHVKTL